MPELNMPIYHDPAVTAATVALKHEQTKLTALRREHLAGDYVKIDDAKDAVTKLGSEIKVILQNFPRALRRKFPDIIDLNTEDEIFDFFSAYVESNVNELFWKMTLTPSKPPVRVYTSKPGPQGPNKNPGVKGTSKNPAVQARLARQASREAARR
jgi:hypothetical protein